MDSSIFSIFANTKSLKYPTDQNYTTAINKLNGYQNVQTLGYVDTNYTHRAYKKVISDIAVYASWAGYTKNKMNISIAGIFFDDVAEDDTNTVYTYMQNASTYAYATVPSDITPVVFNPGVVPPTTRLFNYCDTLLDFEGAFSAYKNDTTIATIPSGYRGQSAIVVHDTPSSTSVATIKSLVHTMALNGIEAVYFSADTYSNSSSPTMLAQLAQAVQAE